MTNTVERINSKYVLPLLDMLLVKFEKNPKVSKMGVVDV